MLHDYFERVHKSMTECGDKQTDRDTDRGKHGQEQAHTGASTRTNTGKKIKF
jgi:hypothetical protein